LTREGEFNLTFLSDLYCLIKNNIHSEVYTGIQLEFDILLNKVFDSIESETSLKGGGGSS